MTEPDERVVLVDDEGTAIGSAEKATVHNDRTPLHLAFSCHVSDAAGRVLVTRRALSKPTWPGVWTNSFCGHPFPGEDLTAAVARRATHELGIEVTDVRIVLPAFRYRAVDATGAVENEICPVFTAITLDEVRPDPHEVAEHRWIEPADLDVAVRAAPWAFSPWLHLQMLELAAVHAR